MVLYICRKCGYESPKEGKCPECNEVLEKACPVCKNAVSFCTCTGSIPQTKGPGKH